MSNVPVLFDVNGCFGKPSSGGADFPTMADRLAHMNRLGVSRALVWNVDSVQNNALAGNETLLAAIRQAPGAEGRIFPALAVSALTQYEKDGLRRLEAQLRAIPCRALRFVNTYGRLTLMQLEPVMRRIRSLRPFLVLKHDQASVADILEFTRTFPEIHLVLTDVTWGPCVIAFDLLRRRRNILIDISWMHTFHAVELLVRRFGADRVVFGMGSGSHNGAAIAALARAGIPAEQRHKIAYGNLDRLTGLRTRAAAMPAWKANTLWTRFVEGKTRGVDVVDAHGHLGPSGGYVLEEQEEAGQLTAGLHDMDRIGIRLLLLSGMQALAGDPVAGNAVVERHLRPHAGRVSGYVVFNPAYAAELAPRLDGYFSGPVFQGFKTLTSYWGTPITDKRFKPMWDYAARHRLPVLSHTWGGSGFDTPAMFRKLAGRYPRVHFILGHSGGSDQGRREAESLAADYPNVYLETCGSFCSTIRWEETLKRVPVRQVLFGTDAMAHDFNWELGRMLSLDVPDRILTPILGTNMRRVLAMRK